jgi:hypothetical protein
MIRELEQLGGASFNFGPKYFADLDLADRERIRVAKQLAGDCALARQLYLEKLRLYCQEGATHCAYCMNALPELRHTRAIGDRILRWIFGQEGGGSRGDTDLRGAGSAVRPRSLTGSGEDVVLFQR